MRSASINISTCKSARVPLVFNIFPSFPLASTWAGPFKHATSLPQVADDIFHHTTRALASHPVTPVDPTDPSQPQTVLSETSSKVPLSRARCSHPPTLRPAATALNPFEVHVRLLELRRPGYVSYSTNACACICISHVYKCG